MVRRKLSRREFGRLSAGALIARAPLVRAAARTGTARAPLQEFGYADVRVDSALHRAQLESTHAVLMNLSEDSLLRPFRQMAGQSAPGADLGGWYNYDPNYDYQRDDAGFAPGATFGQWVSALARYHAITGAKSARAKVLRLNELYAATIAESFYDLNRFPAYCYDKLTLGLLDSSRLAGDAQAPAILERTTRAAVPHLPAAAIEHDTPWRPGKDQSWQWDESYTMPENLFLAWRYGFGRQYRDLAVRFLDDATLFDPLSRGENALAGRHAYSYVNSLSSAMQAYLMLGSERHLRAAENAFAMITAQSFPTGGWGPDEKLSPTDGPEVYQSLTDTHHSFETPCGAYAHFKLTRYLLRATHEARYGDSMERVMYNTVLGALPLQADGRAFYYADYNLSGSKVYSDHRFPCCSGTLPQVATDYGINSYFRDPGGIYVNLYLPSTVRWRAGGAQVSLTQTGDYPFADTVAMRLALSQPQHFTVHLRIPAWAGGARIEINGKRWPGGAEPGKFAALTREWHDGDRIDLALPRTLRLEPLDRTHPGTVALMCGPLVLFPIRASGEPPRPQPAELLAARQVAPRRWEATIASAPVTLLPYVAIDEERYTTVMTLTA